MPSPTQKAGAREQTASLMVLDLWVEPPVVPFSASASHALPHMPIMLGALPAPQAPHASRSHNTPTNNTTKPPNMMPGHTPTPDGDRNMQASLASHTSERKMRDTTGQRQQEHAQLRFAAAVAEARTLAILDAHDIACTSRNARPLMSHAGGEGNAADGQLHQN